MYNISFSTLAYVVTITIACWYFQKLKEAYEQQVKDAQYWHWFYSYAFLLSTESVAKQSNKPGAKIREELIREVALMSGVDERDHPDIMRNFENWAKTNVRQAQWILEDKQQRGKTQPASSQKPQLPKSSAPPISKPTNSQPNQSHTNQGKSTSEQVPMVVRSKLYQLIEQPALDRLLDATRKKFPGKPERWIWEKVLHDFERERGVR